MAEDFETHFFTPGRSPTAISLVWLLYRLRQRIRVEDVDVGSTICHMLDMRLAADYAQERE